MENHPAYGDEKDIELFRVTEDPRACSYLPGETASLEYRIIEAATDRTCQMLVSRGWRRFGISFFRPACENCAECRGIRVVVEGFRPSKSQRRCLKRNEKIKAVLQRPGITREHIRLYNAYHADMSRRRGWPDRPIDAGDYIESLIMGAGDFGHEIRYYEGPRLVGVGLVDILSEGVSSVYFYHDPVWRRHGPGTFSILREIRLAKELRKPHLYLGYCIRENPSMSYKSRFRPHEILDGSAADDVPPSWRSPESPPA
ncbi:arginyltransferase [Desulfococcus sp.]|uniref:arginyltransferase n=1 Tax=Desulfococcus sp. TaxID=2025834 RepID=UPI003593A7C6